LSPLGKSEGTGQVKVPLLEAPPTTVNTSLRSPEGPWRSFRVIGPEVVGVQEITTESPATRGTDPSGLLIGFSAAKTALARAAMAKRELVKKRILSLNVVIKSINERRA